MVKTPVLISGDVNTRVESHFSKVPSIATEAFTKNLMVLSPGVIAKTGACARVTDGSAADTNRQRTANRMGSLLEQNRSFMALRSRACHLAAVHPTVKSNR